MSNSPEPKARFTGIFIPVEILELEDITPTEQILLSWIDALYCKERGGCFAHNEYLAKRLRIKENTVAKSITKLRKLGLIEDVSFDGRNRVIRACIGKFVEKRQKENEDESNAGLDLNPMQGWKKIQGRDGEKSKAPLKDIHIIESKEDIKEINSRNSVAPSQESLRLSSLLFEKIKENDPQVKTPNLNKWAVDIDKMIRLDSRDPKDIESLINFCQDSEFWRTNILSAGKLRKQATQLTLQMKKEEKKNAPFKEQSEKHFRYQAYLKDKYGLGPNYLPEVKPRETHVDIMLDSGVVSLSYDEHGFKDQLDSILRKGGLL